MENEFDNFTDKKVRLDETVISGRFISEERYDTDNKQRNIHNYIIIKDENMDDRTVPGFPNHKLCDIEYKQGSIHNYVSIKDENIDDMIVETEHASDWTDDKMCLNGTVISGGCLKQESWDMKDAQGSSHEYLSIQDENINDLTAVAHKTELITDDIDNKICVYETIITGGYIKQEPCDTDDKLGSIHNDINMKGCEECGEEYDLYCLQCPMLIRIFDSNSPDGKSNTVRWTLPRNFVDIHKTGVGIVALRTVPKGVVFGPFKGLHVTKDDTVSKWKLKNKELVYAKNPRWLNWMQYIKRADQSSHPNLIPFQYKGELYYRSDCHINVGEELLVCWDSDSKESEIQDMEDSYWEPWVCESLDDSYACTFCCVGYKCKSHLTAHNSTCIEKRNRNDYCEEIVQCDICKIYLDKKEYSDYHMYRCCKSNGKCVFNSSYRRNRGRPLRCPIHNGDRPFSCTLCSYKTTAKSALKRHMAAHNNERPFACSLCPYQATIKSNLKQHMAIHNDDRPFECTLCPYKTTTKANLKHHVAIHNDDRPFACTLCPYKGKTKANLKQHIATHNSDKPFTCALCPYKATRTTLLKQHMTVHNGNRPYACTRCPYKATSKSNLRLHMTAHNDDRPFACTLCLYRAKRKSLLKKHIAIHTGDKPFVCTLCPYKTTTNSLLKRHFATHNGDKPFACTLCPYKAKENWILKQHIASHNGGKPFACTLCPYKTTRKAILKQHIAIHNGDKAFSCTLCSFKAKTNVSLKRHLVSHNE